MRLLLHLLLTLPAGVQAQDFAYETVNGTITITGYSGPGGVVAIPATITGLPVTSIGDNAFRDVASLTTVAIPDNVISIGGYAFWNCTNLTTITIASSITSIGNAAFKECSSLANVAIPSGVTSIGDQAFSDCTSLMAITVDADNSAYGSVDGVLFDKTQTTLIQCPGGKSGSYIIPGSTTSIGNNAFSSCTSLTSVTIPSGVTTVGDYAFQGCTSLTSVTIGSGVTSIGFGAFSHCPNLTAIIVNVGNPTYSTVDGVLFNKTRTTLIQFPGGKIGNFTIPNSVTIIGLYAFQGCTSLANVTIPSSVTNIYYGAFQGCTRLTIVTIPSSVTILGDSMFSGCTSLTSVTIGSGVASMGFGSFSFCPNLTTIVVNAGNSTYSSVDGVVFNKTRTTLIQFPGGKAGNYTIPNGVTSIGGGAFGNCTSLSSITIGNGVTSLGDWTFSECNNLIRVTIGSGITSIGDATFIGCTSLNGVYFLGKAPSVSSSSFEGDNAAIVYYLPGTTGWDSTLGGRPTALWKPQAQASGTSFGIRTNRFGFNIAWASGRVVVVEACTDLAQPLWSPVGTNTLTAGSSYFNDPQWTNYPTRFYRLRSP